MFSDLDDIGTGDYNASPPNQEKKAYGGKPDFSQFKKKPISNIPYIPICIFVDKEYSSTIKDTLYKLINQLLSKNYTVRVNGDDVEFTNRIKGMADTRLEIYIPWKGFNNIETKHYFSDNAFKHIAETNFAAWEKVPGPVQAILARNVRMMLGGSNNSCTNSIVLFTEDGASKLNEISTKTGRPSFIIKLACKYGITVINLGKPNLLNAFIQNYGLDPL